MQDIGNDIAGGYGLDVKSVTPFKDAYIVSTSLGKKMMRKSTLTPDRIMFVHGAKEHLAERGFSNIDRYVTTVESKPYIHIENSTYTLSDFIEGRECNFDNRQDIIASAHLLASMHMASKGYIPPEGSCLKTELGKLPVYFSRRLDEIKKLKKNAKKGRSKFDYLFLDYVDYFYDLGENALGSLNSSVYEKLVEDSRIEGVFCHHDFTYRNIICNNNTYFLTNFDFCCFELKVYDIANFLRRKMRKCMWDIEEAKVIIREYRKTENISEDDFMIMRIILQFPQKFWRVANKFYNSRRSWSEKSHVIKLQEVIDEIEYHRRFLERFEELMK